MAKRPSLADSMKSFQSAPTPAAAPAAVARRADAPDPASSVTPTAGRGYFAATRQGKKRVTFPASEENHRRLKRLSADTGQSIEALMSEALDDLFAKKGA